MERIGDKVMEYTDGLGQSLTANPTVHVHVLQFITAAGSCVQPCEIRLAGSVQELLIRQHCRLG